MSGTGIDRAAIARFMNDLQNEFNRHPIQVPVNADQPELSRGATIYNGPVIFGDANGAQLAWNSHSVSQSGKDSQPIAPGMEPIAEAVIAVLQRLSEIDLAADDEALANEAGDSVLAAVTQPTPDLGTIRRGLTLLKGSLSHLAIAAQAGVDAEVAEWAQHTIAHLGSLL